MDLQTLHNLIYIWIVNIPDFIHRLDGYRSLLSPMELEKAKRFLFCEHQNRFIITKSIQRILVGQYLNLDPHSIEFEFGTYGKPSIKNNKELNFNISHSDDMAILAFKWGSEIGVDVEKNSPSFLGQGIEEIIFSDNETREYLSADIWDRTEMFFRTWTRKESIIKCTGRGLTQDLKQVSSLQTPGIYTHSFTPAPEYSGAVSTYDPNSVLVFKNLE